MTSGARSVPVLMYHHVSTSPGMITVTPANFAAQMAYLASAGYRTLGARQLAGFLAGEPVPPKSLVLTFDDGYLDNWVHAHPVLLRHGFTAICFLVSGWPGEGAPRANASEVAAGLNGAKLPRLLNHREGEIAIDEGRADEAILRWSEIDAMRRAGTFEFHSHTHRHVRWDQVAGSRAEKRASMRNDLLAARVTLDERLGGASDHLCWPQGYYDDDYCEIAREAGFRHFYTCHPGANVSAADVQHDADRSINRLEVRDRVGRLDQSARPSRTQCLIRK